MCILMVIVVLWVILIFANDRKIYGGPVTVSLDFQQRYVN